MSFLLFILLPQSACVLNAASQDYTQIATQQFTVPPEKLLILQIDQAEVTLEGNLGDHIFLEGSHPQQSSVTLTIVEGEYTLLIRSEIDRTFRNRSLLPKLSIKVPLGLEVEAQIDRGQVTIQSWDGTMRLRSISAEIYAYQLTGEFLALSPRGAIELVSSSGNIHLVSQAGSIEIYKSSGKIAATTIMGDILYQGTPQYGDTLHFESDHGSVQLHVGPGADVDFDLNTTGGVISCTYPDLAGVAEACSGSLGFGGGSVYVRTVSGAIRVHPIP